jgi:hypothetical protein
MTIIGLQRRLVQVGRIRMGTRTDKGAPKRLDHWRLTSRDQVRLEHAARLYGGTVQEWAGHQGEYELYTSSDQLPVLLLPGQTLSQHYELWSGGGCKRRCDGQTEQLTDGPCLCDPEVRECKPVTRLNVLLPEVPGVGAWRLDSTGYYAAVELTGTVDLLEFATAKGVLVPARLRIDQRMILRDGQTRRFPVPTLDIDITALQAHQLAKPAIAELEPVYQPVAEPSNGPTLAQGLELAAAGINPGATTARSAAPIGDAEPLGDDLPLPVDDPGAGLGETTDEPPRASSEQQKLLMARARELKIPDKDRYDLTAETCGDDTRSIKRVPAAKVDELLAAFDLHAVTRTAETNLFELGAALDLDVIPAMEKQAAEMGRADYYTWLRRQIERLSMSATRGAEES